MRREISCVQSWIQGRFSESQGEDLNWAPGVLHGEVLGLQGLFSSVQSLSRFVTPWNAARRASLSITSSRSLLTLVHHISNAIQTSHPLSSPSPPDFNLAQNQGLFRGVSS